MTILDPVPDPAVAALVAPIEHGPLIDRVLAWSAIGSGTRNMAGLATMSAHLADAFAALPGDVELVEPAVVEEVDATGRSVQVPAGRHLVARVRPDAARRVLLTGHMDTVYGVDDPFRDTHWLDDRRLRGPGALDMKSGLAVMLAGLMAFERTNPRLGYDVMINSDEETGSLSSAGLIATLAQGKAAALTYEPSLPGGAIARSRPGSGNYAVVIRGRAAHAGRNPQDGRNAIVAASDFAVRLARARHPGLSINPARIDGGGPGNVVPALAVLRFNLRPRGIAETAEATALVARIAGEIGVEHDVAVAVNGGLGRPAKPVGPDAERLFALVAESAAQIGPVPEWRDSGGVCDGNNIAHHGVPVIDTMGCDGDFIHSPDEYLDTASLVPKACLTALVLHRIEQGAMPG